MDDYDVLHDGGVVVMDNYSDEQMTLRQEVLKILFREFGDGKYSNKAIYECADEWCSKGHKISSGVVKYYKAYYNKVA